MTWLTRATALLAAVALCTSSPGFYTDDGHETSAPLQPLDPREQKEVQREILGVLGLERRPKPKHARLDNAAPVYMLDLYSSLQTVMEDEDNDKHIRHLTAGPLGGGDYVISNIKEADMIMSFDNQIPRAENPEHKRFRFDFSRLTADEPVIAAELRLFHEPSRHRGEERHFTLQLFSLPQDGGEQVLQSTSSVNSSFHGWIIMNATQAAGSWRLHPASNRGLYLLVTDEDGEEVANIRQAGFASHNGTRSHRPFLIAYFNTPEEVLHSRQKRALARASPATSSGHSMKDDRKNFMFVTNPSARYARRACQRRQLYISFKDLNWKDWIISPDGFPAFHCDGECAFPLSSHMNVTNHAIIQVLVHTMNTFNYPRPCCVPTTLTAVQMLYFDDSHNVVLRKYHNMIVKACGCR